jgi:hypothetical protein
VTKPDTDYFFNIKYLPGSKRRHLVPVGAIRAVCSLQPLFSDAWLGTGSQAEYDRADMLTNCARCWSGFES